MTQWKRIPGWEKYEVSENGMVRRDGYIRKPYLASTGYFCLALRQNGRIRAMGVHRIVALAFLGLPPFPRAEAAHNDGVSTNNHVSNLRWASRAENQADRVKHGTSNRGERQHMARLTKDKVIEALIWLQMGAPQPFVAQRFGVARTTIQALAERRSWYWIDDSEIDEAFVEMMRGEPRGRTPLFAGARP